MRPITSRERDELLAAFEREALHLEMRDHYAMPDEAERLTRFLELGYRDHEAEAGERRFWTRLIADAKAAGKSVRRARVVSEPVTDYVRYLWAGTDPIVEAGEEVRWLPRSRASALALPGNDFWLFDDRVAVFAVFSGVGAVVAREASEDPGVVALCRSAFDAVWALATPHGEYVPK
ncbi:hypothetical protein LO762_01560 [Actinocorallia sp. API 0066]|uniref:DUF6879 family protein n=1 Tax=Actinocorallia sp. API 0066 TaxID=2896846 RepID=UPI001E33E6B6|nr:DUF6879 family protein [Actinocorallia sp. API 0066]MCD0447887.1 hypothetical protein [Actinocorallia sp. API 0066]